MNELIVLSSPGLAIVLVFQKQASSIKKIAESDDQPTDESKAAKCIWKEISNLVLNKNEYELHIDKAAAKECVSETLRALPSQISDDLSANELPTILIGNIITSEVRKKPTSPLIHLALLVKKKKLIKNLYNYKVVCFFGEVKRFKVSAAVENTKNITLNLRNHTQRLVQAVADNFDTTISSQNRKSKPTHSQCY